jgi:hypothetical protein
MFIAQIIPACQRFFNAMLVIFYKSVIQVFILFMSSINNVLQRVLEQRLPSQREAR